MILNQFKVFFIVLILSLGLSAQDSFQDKFNYSLQELRDLKHDDYAKSVNKISAELNRLLDYQRRVCSGEFSTLAITKTKDDNELALVKLNKKDRAECLEKVDVENIVFLKTLYSKRISYLNHIHKKRIKSLEASMKQKIDSLNKKPNRKKRKKRKK